MSAVAYRHNWRTAPVSFPAPLRGFGALAPQNQNIANAAATAASATGAIAAALSGIPIIGPAVNAAVSIGLALANIFAGCGQKCVETTNLANQAEPLLQQNLDNYMSAPVHYASMQAAALNNFDLTWNALTSACSNPQLGAAGQSCISDREQGACHYQTSPGGWVNGTYQNPGAQGSGSTCWNWFVGYRDPIANDPTVVADPIPGSGVVSSLLSSVGISTSGTVFGLPIVDVALLGLALFAASELI